jgi:hypothetical protein
VKPAEVEYRLLRAERRALDGPQFSSPAAILARTFDLLHKLRLDQRGRRKRKRFYAYATEYCQKRIFELSLLVSASELEKALDDLARADFTDPERQVLGACWAIFERTGSEPSSGVAVIEEIKAMLRGHKDCVSSSPTYQRVINRLDIPVKSGNRGPVRGARRRKLISQK